MPQTGQISAKCGDLEAGPLPWLGGFSAIAARTATSSMVSTPFREIGRHNLTARRVTLRRLRVRSRWPCHHQPLCTTHFPTRSLTALPYSHRRHRRICLDKDVRELPTRSPIVVKRKQVVTRACGLGFCGSDGRIDSCVYTPVA